MTEARSFGRDVRQLRRARERTQAQLATRAGLSADTIRRLEHGSFSPSLDTLRSLCRGLNLRLSTLFSMHEVGERNPFAEFVDMVRGRSELDIELATNVLRTLLDEFDAGRFDQPDEETIPMTIERLGAHLKRLREVRRLTQDELADRSGLAADTIRRLEHEEFSPSLRTLQKVCDGLGISVAALFNALVLSDASEHISRITTLLIGRSDAQLQLSERVLTALLDGLDGDPRGRR